MKLYGEAYSMSSLQGIEHVISPNSLLCRDLVRKLTHLYKKGVLLVGSLLAWGV